MNHNCTDQTATGKSGLCLCCSQIPKTGSYVQGLVNVNLSFFGIIKEDISCVFTADEQLGGAKKKYLIGFRSLSTFVHK